MLCIVLSTLMGVVPEPDVNLVTNPTFERQTDDLPEGWRRHSWSGSAAFHVEPQGRERGHSVRIDSTDGADASWFQSVDIHPYGRYRLSGWVKTEDVAAGTGQGALLNIHGIQGAQTPALTGDNDWTYLECEFEIVGGESVQVNALLGGWGEATGTAWYDDIRLEFMGEITPPQSETIATEITMFATPDAEPISKYIYGQFIEHLGRCIYGGIWAEMLEDRKFYFPIPADEPTWKTTPEGAEVLAASPWVPLGDAGRIAMCVEDPLSGEHSPRMTLHGDTAGMYQERLAVEADKAYTGRIVLRAEPGIESVEVRLYWGNDAYDSVIIEDLTDTYAAYPLQFRAGADTENARFEITGRGTGNLTIGTASLMPGDNIQGFRADTLALLKKLNSPIYRWPGGNFVSGYDWRDGLGDRDRRPTRTNPAWTGIEPNDMGMHEFIALCRLIDAEPMITVNTGFGDAHSAAAQVEYANGAVDTPMGAWRAENGSPEPFDVTWWCVGNEMWGPWQLGYMRLEHYVLKHNWVVDKMRKVDADIKTIASGQAGPWSEGMLAECADHMDYIAEHYYLQSRPDITEHAKMPLAPIRNVTNMHRHYRNEMDHLADRDIRIAFTEWNYWYGPHVFGELGTRYFMKDALGIAIGLHEYFRQSDIVHMAFYAQTVNVIGCIKTTGTAAEFEATALPLMLYRNEFGTQPVAVDGTDERLDVAAALTEDGRFLTIGLVNPTWDRYEVTVDTGSYAPQGNGQGWIIAHEDPLAHNHPGEERVIDIEELPSVDITAPLSLAPISITVIRIPL